MIAASITNIPVTTAAWQERSQYREQSRYPEIWALLDEVYDPEVPALSLWQLGVLCDIARDDKGWLITITPTYSGCPALETMRDDINAAMNAAGHLQHSVDVRLSPAWTTDWLSPQAREQLRDYGIAPPCEQCALTPDEGISCPQCDSTNTSLISEFGSTACKALFQCRDCQEPFDYFKKI